MKKFLVIIFLVFEAIVAAAQGLDVDSLRNLLATTKDDTKRILLLSDLCNELARYEPDSAIRLAEEGLRRARQIQYPKGEAKLLIVLGNAYTNVGDYATSIKLLSSNLEYIDQKHDLEIEGGTYAELCAAYRDQGDYDEALKYSYKGITLAKETLTRIPRDRCTFCRGTYLFPASIYLEQKNLDSARKYIDIAFSYPPTSRKNINAYAFYMAGRVQAELKNYDSALNLYRQAILNFAALKHPYKGVPKVYNFMAILFNTMGHRDSALFYLHKSLAISRQKNFGKEILEADLILAEMFEPRSADSALYYYKQAMDTRNVLYDQEKQRQIASYKFDQELQQEQAENAQAQFKNQIKIYGLIGALIIFLALGIILWRNNARIKRAFTLLEKQKTETDYQKGKAERTVVELKATQTQLIQSEKMASLGELTAGIAHEIQNPLNFINNFSELNKELLAEMNEAIGAGNFGEVKAIAKDVIDNDEKINHHGKRADAIVKGMLQHSRSGSGQKELTDINKLADEYLRLAYHGLRAKDKSFSARLKTDFDPTLQKIHVIPQDIGRVVLNLINNAFYAVAEKNKHNLNGFEPTVSVTTKGLNSSIELRVVDNGNGIPDQIKDKIFQPFFTTKPTGQGTGLGLSLSYDIVKAHGGTLEVTSREGEGSEFVILLPVQMV